MAFDIVARGLEPTVHTHVTDGRLPVELPAASFQPAAATLSLTCSVCGYGAICAVAPRQCPMCQDEGSWQTDPAGPRRTGPRNGY